MSLKERIYSVEVQKKKEGSKVVLAGWAESVKNLGKIAFVNLRDREGSVQLTVFSSFKHFDDITKIPRESVIAVNGVVKDSKLKSGAKEVHVDALELISKAGQPLPIELSEKINTVLDKRLDNRFLDLRHPKRTAIFKIRSQALAALREFLWSEGFVEMQTPKIISAGAEGGATLFPVSYYNKKAYLSQSQQLYKQIMLSAGFDRVFELGPSFRAEKSHTMRHLTEFTQLDFEMAFIDDEDDVLKVFERMFVHLLKNVGDACKQQLQLLDATLSIPKLPFPRITYADAVKMLKKAGSKIKDGDDIGAEDEKLMGKLVLEKFGTESYFLTKYPYAIKPFYIMTDGKVSSGFDFMYRGEELASGGQREHRAEVLEKQIKEKGLKPKDFQFYIDAFRYGCPPHAGFGLGIDRLVKIMLGLDNIREAVLFPRDPERLTP